MQIIGPRYEDDTPITFAELLTTITSDTGPVTGCSPPHGAR